MKIELEVRGLSVDAWLEDYLRTTVVFAIWHHAPPVDGIRVALHRSGERVRCLVRLELTDGRCVSAHASGASGFEAVRDACDRLEVELYRCGGPGTPEPQGRLAA